MAVESVVNSPSNPHFPTSDEKRLPLARLHMDRGRVLMELYTPPQNGVAERFNRFIRDIARASLFDSGLVKAYWKYAVQTANYLRNRTTTIKLEDRTKVTPYEAWAGRKPALANLRI